MNVLEIKEAVRARVGYRCTECGLSNDQHIADYGQALHVHRVFPGGQYSLARGFCVTLCRVCHGGKEKSPPGTNTSYFMVRVPAPLATALDILVERNVSDRTEEVKRAVREYLERHHLWPPSELEDS